MRKVIIIIIIIILASVALYGREAWQRDSGVASDRVIEASPRSMDLRIMSSVFSHRGNIPVKYTCDGENISPPLKILGVPEKTKSLALIMDDPDVPKHLRPDGLWVHWVMWNIDPKTEDIPEHSVPASAVEGATSSGRPGYGGPCPPDREHRYFFKLYALDTMLKLDVSATKDILEEAMQGHILVQAELMGVYEHTR